jgi:DNA-nicking Smr family endonuclease
MSGPPRRRKLSADDETLWRDVTRSVRPLKRRRAAPQLVESPIIDKAKPAASKPIPHVGAAPAGSAPVRRAPALVPLERRLKQRLVRGTIEIDGRLDLHGRTQSEAHAALVRFLHRAQGDGARTVLVITGKGGGAFDRGEGRGVLKRMVPLWLTLPELRTYVLGFEEAHAAHGGTGALYVRLRRRTRPA